MPSLIAPTILAPAATYIGAGRRRVLYVPTIATIASPSASEMSSGSDITQLIMPGGLNGFTTSSNTVDAGNYGTRKTPQTSGMITFEDSSIDFNADRSGINPIAVLLPRDTVGFIVDCFAGFGTTAAPAKCNIFAMIVTVSTAMTGSADEVVGWHTGYAITDSAENITLPVGP